MKSLHMRQVECLLVHARYLEQRIIDIKISPPENSKAEYLPSSLVHGKGKMKAITTASTVQICCAWCPLIDMHDPNTQKIVSFSIGLLHGVAGPGGIVCMYVLQTKNFTAFSV